MSEGKQTPPPQEALKNQANEATTSKTTDTTSATKAQPAPVANVANKPTATTAPLPTKAPELVETKSAAELGAEQHEAKIKAINEDLQKSKQSDSLSGEEQLKSLKTNKVPTQGRMVVFYFDKQDGICTNNIINSLPATVVSVDEIDEGIINLSVFTLDTRDPVVLRKAIKHKSLVDKNDYDLPTLPYWDWPVIK